MTTFFYIVAEGVTDVTVLNNARDRFPELSEHAEHYVNQALSHVGQHREIFKPSGKKKAVLSTVAAALKPGKNLNASIEDQWFGAGCLDHDSLQPLLQFLEALLGVPPISPGGAADSRA